MQGTRSSAAFYADSLDAFLSASDDEVYAPLTIPDGCTLAPEQVSAWRLQLPVLRAALAEIAPRLAADPAAPAPWLVQREALARDDLDHAKLTDPRARIGISRTAVRAFIQNVHHFRDATLRDPAAPADHVVVFDEAQRAWDARQLASFMKRKKGLPGFNLPWKKRRQPNPRSRARNACRPSSFGTPWAMSCRRSVPVRTRTRPARFSSPTGP